MSQATAPVTKLNASDDAASSRASECPSVAIVIYSLFGHIKKMAEAEKAGIEAAGGNATIYQVAETLPASMLERVPKAEYPVIQPQDLLKHDGILVGVAARFASMPSQMKAFWDSTGQLWLSKALAGKFVGAFVSTGSVLKLYKQHHSDDPSSRL
ncbi:hypothetical protein FRB94_010833 [Tulasnella sp. JGI-2019a]|nr:hypothetical protein FRB94_010833 [Tulasnella sp. JGI-2019a]